MHSGMILLADFHLLRWDYYQFSWHFIAQRHNNYFKKQILLLVRIEYVLLNYFNVLLSLERMAKLTCMKIYAKIFFLLIFLKCTANK